MTYTDLLLRKKATIAPSGLAKIPDLSPVLFDFQRNCVEQSLRYAGYAFFLDTGLGKTLCQLERCRCLPGKSLILAPLAVSEQTKREAESKLGLEVHHSRDGKRKSRITITNYERAHLFDLSEFDNVFLDESSILKSFMGKTKRWLCEAFDRTHYKGAGTATPAPNDYMELGNHAEFLGIMSGSEMLSRWFINDTMHFGHYRLKGHAVQSFWEWVASWAACVERPSDAGGDDAPFVLPPLKTNVHQVDAHCDEGAQDGMLFRVPEMSATSMHKEKRYSLDDRLAKAVSLCWPDKHNIIWCATNVESKRIAEALGDKCMEVTGSMSVDEKEERIDAFSRGQVRDIVTKPGICGFGLNWQHCYHQIHPSISYSYEEFYQAVRRSWRFGQTNPVVVDVVLSESELPLWKVVSDKMRSHQTMKTAMRYAKFSLAKTRKVKLDYNPTHEGKLPQWLAQDSGFQV